VAVALRYAARSDVGLLRKSNQDSGYAGPHLLVVADGMGGAAGGDVASSVVVSHLAPLDDDAPSGDLLGRLRESVHEAHSELLVRVAEDPALAGLGTTVVALLRSGDRFAMIHIGDSRAYLLRDDELLQVTTDHTFVQHLVEAGRLTAEEAEHHPQRSVLLRVLGDNESDIVLDEWTHEAKVGDRWLLCSDGLSGVVSAETIQYVLTSIQDVDACADALVSLALRAGGPDNVTVVVADVLDLDSLPDGAAPALAAQAVGAASGRSSRPTAGAGGAAGRAAALGTESSSGEEDDAGDDVGPRGEPRSRARTLVSLLLGTLVALALIVAIGAAGFRWSQAQYYVGVDNGYVAVFRGIPQQLGSLELSQVEERSAIRLADLPPFARQRLEEPISADSLEAAQEIVDLLAAELPPEPEPTPAPTAVPTDAPGVAA
jgi:protein phosphatase